MNFCPKDLCERLQKLGCVSEGEFFWNGNEVEWSKYLVTQAPLILTQAFIPQDFIGPTEGARENCRIVFGDKCPDIGGCRTGDVDKPHSWVWQYHRHKLTDLPTEAAFWAYIEEAIKEAA